MNNYINNIILYFLVIIILHLLIKIYLLESITEEFIQPTQPTLNNYIDENCFINNYDNNAKNELLGYLDNDLTSNSLPIDNTNDPTNTFSIDNTKNELLGYLDNMIGEYQWINTLLMKFLHLVIMKLNGQKIKHLLEFQHLVIIKHLVEFQHLVLIKLMLLMEQVKLKHLMNPIICIIHLIRFSIFFNCEY